MELKFKSKIMKSTNIHTAITKNAKKLFLEIFTVYPLTNTLRT